MSRLRKVVAERAVVSMQSSAQLTTVVEVDVTKVAAFRDQVKGDFLAKTGVKLSFLPFFALAAAEALKTYPVINATIDGDTHRLPGPREHLDRGRHRARTAHPGGAQRRRARPRRARQADRGPRRAHPRQQAEARRARRRHVHADQHRFARRAVRHPARVPPAGAILGTGIVARSRSWSCDADGTDSIAIRSTVYLALSYDHRIVDGADAARFLVAVKNRLEGGNFEDNLGI